MEHFQILFSSKHDPDNQSGKPPKGGSLPVSLRNVKILDEILVSEFRQQSVRMFRHTQVGYGMQEWVHIYIFFHLLHINYLSKTMQ